MTVTVNVTVFKPHQSEPNFSLLRLYKLAKRIQTHENKRIKNLSNGDRKDKKNKKYSGNWNLFVKLLKCGNKQQK